MNRVDDGRGTSSKTITQKQAYAYSGPYYPGSYSVYDVQRPATEAKGVPDLLHRRGIQASEWRVNRDVARRQLAQGLGRQEHADTTRRAAEMLGGRLGVAKVDERVVHQRMIDEVD